MIGYKAVTVYIIHISWLHDSQVIKHMTMDLRMQIYCSLVKQENDNNVENWTVALKNHANNCPSFNFIVSG